MYAGADGPLVYRPHREIKFHLEDGFNDIKFNDTPDTSRVQEETAVSAIQRMVRQQPGKIDSLAHR